MNVSCSPIYKIDNEHKKNKLNKIPIQEILI